MSDYLTTKMLVEEARNWLESKYGPAVTEQDKNTIAMFIRVAATNEATRMRDKAKALVDGISHNITQLYPEN